MNLKQCFLTENDCYKSGQKHTVKGIMVHSTGANNPNLKRYVQPDDGLLGKNSNNNSWNTPTPSGQQVCVHAFIGKLADGSIATYQTLPWDIVGWHSGSGSKGNANRMGYVGFEICEDGLTDATYFSKVYTEAVELCAYLCKLYGLDPKTAIICHSEGHTQGIASNHGDVMHWFPKHGKNMDIFRTDVAEKLGSVGSVTVYLPASGYTVDSTNEVTVFNFLKEVMGLNIAAACGVLANINAESGFKPTALGDGGTSYGICQWHNTRCTNLKNWCAQSAKDYTTLDGQLWFLKYELEKSYASVLSAVKSVENTEAGAYDAGYVWCKRFEIPADTENASVRRGNSAKTYWTKYGGTSSVVAPTVPYKLVIGDVVTFIGSKHYSSSNSSTGVSCRPGKAQITAIYKSGKHPYHLIRVQGGTSNVYGWVDTADIYESTEAAPSENETEPTVTQPVIPVSVRDLKLTSPMMEGDDVKALQSKLLVLEYDLGSMGADGEYGAKTDAAVRLFQTRAKNVTIGICNNAMRTVLNL